MPPSAHKIQIPRWMQLVGLPLVLLFLWTLASTVAHVVFLFIVAALIALLLDPLVRALGRMRIPRGFSVAVVFLSFATVLVVGVIAIGVVVVDQSREAADRIDAYLTVERGQSSQTDAERDVDRLQGWLNDHGLERVKVEEQGQDFVDSLRDADPQEYTSRVIDFLEGAALSIFEILFSLVLIIVVSIYMLLDMGRLSAAVDRRFPPRPDSGSLIPRIESALAGYVRGQVLLSLIIGVSAGVGLWVLGTLGWAEGMDQYALLFGAWVGFMELIPYLGPWLGAIPPVTYALIVDPVSAIWVTLLFLAIHQIEGHIVVPNVMGSALRLHPLLVIFGLLAGGEIYGLAGIFVALPLLAVLRALWEFAGERIELENWRGEGPVPVEVEVEPEPPVQEAPVPPRANVGS
ncbi:MAG TPA: AI-2E family transporter [Gaiellaceae bacterium]|jgi:predicted PurR-regulated permease PerM|nr:AI-2E family transporter [Gaiellaceae bacterium]